MSAQAASPKGATSTVLIIGAGMYHHVAQASRLPKASRRLAFSFTSSSSTASSLTYLPAGIHSIVFEREPPNFNRARDWNFGVHWSIPILQELISPAAFAQIESAQVDPHRPCPPSETIRFLHGETGEQIGASETPHIYRLRRSKLRAIIAEGLDIQYDKTISDISYADDGSLVTAHFTDGTSTSGALLVGTDGHRSAVRTLLLGPKNAALTPLPFGASIVQAKYTTPQVHFLRSFHPLFVAAAHPAGLFSWVGLHHAPDPDDPENWIMNHYVSWPSSLEEQERSKEWTNAMRLKELKDLGARFADPFKSAFEWLGEDQVVWYSPLSQWDPSLEDHQWDNHDGRVTLAGDAAHPMTFQRGQGLNSGIKDAAELVHHITSFLSPTSSTAQSTSTPPTKTRLEALAAYEQEMKQRTGTEVRLSRANTEMVHQWDKVLQSPLVSKGFSKTETVKAEAVVVPEVKPAVGAKVGDSAETTSA